MGFLGRGNGARATVSIALSTGGVTVGGKISGHLILTSEEDFEAAEVRLELDGVEKCMMGNGGVWEGPGDDAMETPETRLYSPDLDPIRSDGSGMEFQMCKEKRVIGQNVRVAKGLRQEIPFEISVPKLGPSFRGTRRDGVQLDRNWSLKGVAAIPRRGDIEGKIALQVGLADSVRAP